MNDPENIVAAIYRAVDWINGESNLALLVAGAEGKYRSTRHFVECALWNTLLSEIWNCDHMAIYDQKKGKKNLCDYSKIFTIIL